jgi:probable F420-dependent oxidoreductase
MEFGFSLATDPPLAPRVELAKLAEANGFTYGWVWDSHILMQEYSVLMTMLAQSTSRLVLGACVTNPVTRDPTVTASFYATLANLIGGARLVCGIGRGDSAVRIRSARPSNLAALEQLAHVVRGLTRGDEVVIDGHPVRLAWATGGAVPVFVASYGPKALRLAGRVGDGVVLQIADPYVIRWSLEQVRAGAEEVGRDLTGFRVSCAAPSFVSDDIERAREETRWFGALVGNHVADMLKYHDPAGVPAELTEYVKAREGYDYREHTRQGTAHSRYVPDEVVERFSVIGSVERVRERLRELAELGVTEFNIYTAVSSPELVIETYGREIVPVLAGARVA